MMIHILEFKKLRKKSKFSAELELSLPCLSRQSFPFYAIINKAFQSEPLMKGIIKSSFTYTNFCMFGCSISSCLFQNNSNFHKVI